MADDQRPPSLDDLGRRLKAARSGRTGARDRQSGPRGDEGLGLGLRIVVELVAAVGIGGAIGFGLDRWLGTLPWLMLLFLILGFAAGIANVYRAAQGYERRQREKKNAGDPDQ